MIQLLWGLINDLSFLTVLSLVSISTPGIGQAIQSQMLKFICFDILMTDKWFTKIFYADEESGSKGRILTPSKNADHALNSYFEINGFESMSLIKNLGSTFIYLLIYLLGLLILLLLTILKPLTNAFHL